MPSSGLVSKAARNTVSKARLPKSYAGCTVALIASGLFATYCSPARAQTVSLGVAQNFAVLGSTTVTNTGPTLITGNLGVSLGSAITGFPPGAVTQGTLHANDALAFSSSCRRLYGLQHTGRRGADSQLNWTEFRRYDVESRGL